MSSRPVPSPQSSLLLPPVLCGPVEHYVAAWAVGRSAFDPGARFDKRNKITHRFSIADTRGRLDLTVPIVKPASSHCLWSDILVSTHGAWWDIHRVALESAYGRTPYFEFYIDSFLPMLTVGVESRFPRLTDLQQAWDERIREHLGLEPAADPDSLTDPLTLPTEIPTEPYRQIRAGRLGFIPGLSVLDLLFNLGPEAQIYLHRMAKSLISP
ncbi:MAG: WbqC family protein [Duncaniella sp.]|nr:WbqC family protein [Duncaniella sp.]